MSTINLIPLPRREMRKDLHIRKFWKYACSAYGLVMLAAAAVLLVTAEDGTGYQQIELATTTKSVEDVQKAIAADQAKLEELVRTLNASRRLRHRPDWSALMLVIANAAGENIAFTRFELLEPAPTGATSPRSPNPTGGSPPVAEVSVFRLKVAGVAQGPEDQSRFVLALEKTGLFRQVRILTSEVTQIGQTQVTRFEFDCQIGQPDKRDK